MAQLRDMHNDPDPSIRPIFLGGEIYRTSSYGRRHPLSIPRVTVAMDLSRAMGWLPDAAYRESPEATEDQLARFHERDYIAAVRRAEAEQRVDAETLARFNLGRMENPIFPEMYRRPATGCGAAILAAELVGNGGIVYSPASGTHHARPGRASGFCYFNAPVLAILTLLEQGLSRIYYVDLDAHHGDGVEEAFHQDSRVLTLSVHEAGRWPYTGKAQDRAGGMARNLPVPEGFNDTELRHLLDEVIIPLGHRFQPEALVLQTGSDALADDPQSRLSLSNRALWEAVRRLVPLAPRCLVVGGGGYNPWAVGRCWSGIWATLNGWDPAGTPTAQAEMVLRGLQWEHRMGRSPPEHWFTTLADPPNEGAVREEVRALAREVMAP